MNGSPFVELTQELTYRHSLGYMAPFFSALAEARIMGTTCVLCNRTYVPPRRRCPIDANEANWTDVSSSGVVVASSTIARRPRYAAAGGSELVLGLVQLDGVETAMVAEILHDGAVSSGARVDAVFRSATEHPAQQLAFSVQTPPVATGDEP